MTRRIAVLVFTAMALPAGAQDDARVIVGFEQSAAAAASPAQKMFADLYFAQSLWPRLAVWEDLRLTSLPQPINSTALTLPADILSAAATMPLNRIAQSGEFRAGVASRVAGSAAAASLSLIAGYGAVAPTNMIAQRSGLFREYHAGVRITGNSKAPHSLDVTIGQNEAITGGRLAGSVLRFDSFYALPGALLGTGTGFVYLFGSMAFKTSARSFVQQSGSDVYQVGIGIDFVQMLKAFRNK
jgi:hypothetical protein